MAETTFAKIAVPKAAVICADLELNEEAKVILERDPNPADFVRQLMAQDLLHEAIKFMARALPKREATWWACLAARTELTESSTQEQLIAVEIAEQWVYKPTEENRRLTYSAAHAANFDSAAAWAAMAAFWSGGSMAPPEAPVVPPAENLTGKAVAGAIMLAAVRREPEKANDKIKTFLAQAINIAQGGNGRLDAA
jgi:hypothetical protein